MIEYVIEQNPDDRVLKRASEILSIGGVVCFPTDTNWIIACDPNSKSGVEKLYRLKKEDKKKHFSLLCDSFSMASDLAMIDNQAFKLIKKVSPGHYTFIFEAKRNIAKTIKATKTDKQIGVRFVPTTLANRLVEAHGSALLSTNILKSMIGVSEEDTVYSYMIEEALSEIDLIIDPGEFEFVGPSTIIDFSQGTGPMVVREGMGSIDNFI